MKNMPLTSELIAQFATKLRALTVLLCVGLLSSAYAQSKPGGARQLPDERNLQVQLASTVAASPAANSAQRVALVIGNGAYKDAPLTNPVNDARAIAQALKESGFSVIIRENVDQRGMLSALREFGDLLRAGGTGLFYYAGHGMQIKGRNYLIPVGASIDREDEVAYSAVDAQAVLDKMEAAGNVANIMILDACRNNPFTRSTRSGQAGLAQMDAPVGTLVAYATSPGAVASDGSGTNGLYTQHLLNAIRQPSSKVEDVFKQVRANVRRDSQGKQVPWESTSLEGDFYFRGGPVVAAPADPHAGLETVLWDAVKGSNLPVEIRAYLNRYPSGKFAGDARARLAQLQSVQQATGGAVPAPAATASPAAVATTVQVATAAMAPAKVSVAQTANQTGDVRNFFAGDRWRFQVVDKFKGEVVRNYVNTVDRLQPDGSAVLNQGSLRWDAKGNLRYVRSSDRERTLSVGYINIPPVLQAGAKTPLNYEIDHKFTDGRQGKEEAKGTMVVKAQEKVTTPAGEFNAWRVEIEVFGSMQIVGSTSGAYRWVFVGWYVPELRTYVAFDDESRAANGSFNRRDRHELTSFSVRGAEHLAQR